MVKKLLFAVLLLSLQVNPWSVLAINGPKVATVPTDACTAPPPDTIRVTSIGYNYVTVAWDPTPLVQNYRLTVYKKNPSNNWDSLYSVNLVNTTTYTIDDLEPQEEYMAGIRSVCQNGEPGTESYSNPIHGLIVELTLGGRRPINPVHVDCNNIDYLDPHNEWIGFRLTKYQEGHLITSLFEVEKLPEGQLVSARIKRVDVDNILVAADDNDKWPQLSALKLPNQLKFQVGEVVNGQFQYFGFLELVSYTQSPIRFDLCPTPDQIWENPYDYEMLVAQKAKPSNCDSCLINNGEKVEGRSYNIDYNPIKIQSPFSNNIQLFFNESIIGRNYGIALLDINGRIIMEKNINVMGKQLSIPVDQISPGFYIFRITSNGSIQNIKVIMSE